MILLEKFLGIYRIPGRITLCGSQPCLVPSLRDNLLQPSLEWKLLVVVLLRPMISFAY